MSVKIPVSTLLAEFQTMLREHWAYDWSGTQRGKVSCAGAFVYAYKQHGISISHGSNYMARCEVVQLVPIGQATIVPGMVAFKHRKPDDANYDLPSKYRQGGASYNGDLNDYYHVGLVDNDTSLVLNAQSVQTGFVASNINKGGWTHVALLKQVDYGSSQPDVQPADRVNEKPSVQPGITYEEACGTAVTVAASGSTVNLRAKPSTSAKLVDRVPLGQTVTLRGPESNGWCPVRWGKKEGYMMAQFLTVNSAAADPSAPVDDDPGEDGNYALTLYDLSREQAEKIAAKYPNNSPCIFETHG